MQNEILSFCCNYQFQCCSIYHCNLVESVNAIVCWLIWYGFCESAQLVFWLTQDSKVTKLSGRMTFVSFIITHFQACIFQNLMKLYSSFCTQDVWTSWNLFLNTVILVSLIKNCFCVESIFCFDGDILTELELQWNLHACIMYFWKWGVSMSSLQCTYMCLVISRSIISIERNWHQSQIPLSQQVTNWHCSQTYEP